MDLTEFAGCCVINVQFRGENETVGRQMDNVLQVPFDISWQDFELLVSC